MIQGMTCSIGCLAMGNEAAEDLFVLAAETGIDNISVILTQIDFQIKQLPARLANTTGWTSDLYASIKEKMMKLGKITN